MHLCHPPTSKVLTSAVFVLPAVQRDGDHDVRAEYVQTA